VHCARRRERTGAGQVSDQAGQDPGAYAPGGATDIVARIIGEQLRIILGQSFVVENNPAPSDLAVEECRAPSRRLHLPDRQRVDQCDHAADLHQEDVDRLPQERHRGDAPGRHPEFILVTTKGFSAKSVPELIDNAKKNPGKVRYGTVGAGSYPHFDMAYFAKKAGDLDMIAIHNKAGASGVINDMLSGDTQVSFLNVASSAPMVKAGELKPLALVNDKRLPEYPDVPTCRNRISGRRHARLQAMFAPAAPRSRSWRRCTRRCCRPCRRRRWSRLQQAEFRIVPNPTVDDAKTWLADEMKNWKTITDTVQIEVTE